MKDNKSSSKKDENKKQEKKIFLGQLHLIGLLLLITCVIVIGFKVILKYFTKSEIKITHNQNNNIRYTLLKETPLYSSPDINDVLAETLERGIRINVIKRMKNQWTFVKTILNNRERWLIEQFLQTTPIIVEEGKNLEIGQESVNVNNPLPFNYKPNDLVKIPAKYLAPYDTRRLYLRKQVLEIIKKMIDDAEKYGFKIRIISAYRSAEYQLKLYQNALLKRKNPDWMGTAKPTYSEHQLGTAIDLSSSEIGYQLNENFENTTAFRWLMNNKDKYNLALSYPRNNSQGYIFEPWHFRYLGKRTN